LQFAILNIKHQATAIEYQLLSIEVTMQKRSSLLRGKMLKRYSVYWLSEMSFNFRSENALSYESSRTFWDFYEKNSENYAFSKSSPKLL